MKNYHPVCSSCSCFKDTLLKSCNGDELSSIIDHKSSRLYLKNQIIYSEGEKPMGLFCIASGKVKISKCNGNGKEQIVRIAKTGDSLGYHALIIGEQYSDSAIVIESSQVCFIPKTEFHNLISANQFVCKDLMTKMSLDYMEAEEFLKAMSFKPVRERMADALLMLNRLYNHSSDSKFCIPFSRGNLSNLVGTAKETTARLITEMINDGIICLEGRNIKILDVQKLSKISQLYE